MSSLADLGDWPSLEIGSRGIVRRAYEAVLNASARLASFATGGPMATDGPINERQKVLAAEDLVNFAINARRLIENTATQKRLKSVSIRQLSKESGNVVPITRVINILIHCKHIEIVRRLFELDLLAGSTSIFETLEKYGTIETQQNDRYFPALVFLVSDRGSKVSFDLRELIETFQLKALNPIIELCEEHHLFLDDFFIE